MYLEKDHVIRPKVGTRKWMKHIAARCIAGQSKYTMPDGRNAQAIRSPIADLLEELYDAQTIIFMALDSGRFDKAGKEVYEDICNTITKIINYVRALVETGQLEGLLKDMPYPKQLKGAEKNDRE